MATDVDGSKSTRVATFSFRVILPSIDSRKKCIENATYQAFTIFAFISFPGSQGFFMETMFPEASSFSLLNSIYIYIIRGRDYVEKVLEASNVFTPRKRKSVFEKMFNNRNVIDPNPDFDNTSLIVK